MSAPYRISPKAWGMEMSERTALAIDEALTLEWDNPTWDTVLDAAWREHERTVILTTGGFDD
jgi:hypothetical protein